MTESETLDIYLDKLKDTINSELQILFAKTGWVTFDIRLLTNLDQLKQNRVTYSISLEGATRDELIADASKDDQ